MTMPSLAHFFTAPVVRTKAMRWLQCLVLGLGAIGASAVSAQSTLIWGPTSSNCSTNLGGNNFWSNFNSYWCDSGTKTNWQSGANALFTQSDSNVTLSTAINANRLTYDKNGGVFTLDGAGFGFFGSPTVNVINYVQYVGFTGVNFSGFTKTGDGALTLLGNNSVSSSINVNTGTLRAYYSNPAHTPLGTSITHIDVQSAGTLEFEYVGPSGTSSNKSIDLYGILRSKGGATTLTYGLSLLGGLSTIDTPAGSSVIFSGVIGGTGSLRKTGAGVL